MTRWQPGVRSLGIGPSATQQGHTITPLPVHVHTLALSPFHASCLFSLNSLQALLEPLRSLKVRLACVQLPH